jgi:5-methyltetrahydropteroyltriglutamate--homocysteine methyltransferase
MKSSSTHILTTHAGSPIRPAEIVEAMIQDHLREPLDKEKFDKDLKVAVEDVVKSRQKSGSMLSTTASSVRAAGSLT